MKKIQKHQIHTLFGIFIFVIILLSNFLKMHYAQDTYHTVSYGYSYTAKNAFLYSGRPITAIAFYIADLLNLSIEMHIFIMTCISIINLSIAVYILFITVEKICYKKNSETNKFLILFVSFICVFNFCTMDLLVFSESGILTMGLLFSVVAGCQWNSEKKNRYLKIAVLSLIGVLCYQGILNIYIPIALVFIVNKNKSSIKKTVKEAFVALLLYGMALILSMLISKLIGNIIMINSRYTIVPTIKSIISTYLKYSVFLVYKTLNIGPKYWYIIIITMISIIYFTSIVKNKYRKQYIFFYITILISAIILPILPLVIQPEDKQYLEPRMCMSFGASIGIMIMYLLITIEIDKINILKKVLIIFIVGLFITNCQYIIQSSSEMIATNLLDRNFAIAIINKIQTYEVENNVEIKNIGIDYDNNMEFYYNGSEKYRCLNLKSLATDWAIEPILKIYGNRKNNFNWINVPEEIHNKYFKEKNWICYSEEQLVFVDDTLYICIY